jgi:signal transduction histidine kinase
LEWVSAAEGPRFAQVVTELIERDNWMNIASAVSLSYIFFFYGLAFFAMGLAVLLELGRTSELRFAHSMPWLAAFGLIHGSHEWVEMFELMGHLPQTLPMDQIRLVLLVVSFACLAAFGFSLGRAEHSPPRVSMWRTLALIGVCLGGMGLLRLRLQPSEWIGAASVWARYSLGVVGAVITSRALIEQGQVFARLGMARFGRDLIWAAVAFTLYGVVGQVFAPKSALPPSNIINSDLFLRLFGMPIQLFRSLVAVGMAIAIIRALRVFETEQKERLRAAQTVALEAERRVQHETTQLNKQLQEAVNELSVLFEMSRILASTLDLQTLLDQAVTRVVDLLPARAAMIVLDAPSSATIAASVGFESNEQDSQVKAAQVIGWDAMAAAEAGPPDVYVDNNRRMTAVPLQAKRGLIGSLVICHQDMVSFESKRSLLLTLGQELAIAIENARLYHQVQEREVLLGDLLRRAVEAQEEERKRIARELHDGIGQVFTALALGLSGVEETMPRDPMLAREQIGNLKELSMRTMTEMRHLVSDLRPAQLDDLGLVPALHWLADEVHDRLRIDVRVQVTGQRHRLAPEIETVLFRITQEALTNVAKHAHAQQAIVQLTFCNGQVELDVQDNGVGMKPEQVNLRQARHQGWGLAGIQERAALVGGTFDIDSAPGHGTRLTVHIPLRTEEVTP